MAGQAARGYIIKLHDGAVTYNAVGGARSKSVTINNTEVDITADETFIQLLEGAGETSVEMALSGVYLDDQYVGDLRTAALGNDHVTMQLIIPGATSGGIIEGDFMITSMTESAERGAHGTYDLSLKSAGTVTFT